MRARGAEVTPVRVYQWDLPEDVAPLREAVHRIAEGQADVAMFTTSIQIPHLFRIAAEERVDEPMLAGPAPHGDRVHRPDNHRDAGGIWSDSPTSRPAIRRWASW